MPIRPKKIALLSTATPSKTTSPVVLKKAQTTLSNEYTGLFVAPHRRYYLGIKRIGDIFFSLFVLLFILSWLTPLLAIIIKADSKGPVFFRQKRIGKNGTPFCCFKFRTMIQNAEADDIPATEKDERITATGRFLRKTNIDELPQFFNVLIGDMSVIGPRPHMLTDCTRFSFVVHSYSFRHCMRPGVTGWAQVNGCHGPLDNHDSIMLRYYWDAMYIRKAVLRLDMRILYLTFILTARNFFFAFRKKKEL